MDIKDAPEPERKDVHITLDVTPGAVAQANEVKVELDHISQILNDVKGNTEATKTNTESIQRLIESTQRLIESARNGIIITVIVGFVAIIITITVTVLH